MSTGIDVFDTTIQKSNLLINEIGRELGWEERPQQTYQALRVVLHALRDRLPAEEAMHFVAQLPLLIKGVFVDGWSLDEVPIKMNRKEFMTRIGDELKLDIEGGIERVVHTVINKVFETIDPAEADKIIAVLPEEIGELIIC
ncbi:MAG: DUF2267 domain-containing protein [Patescibacteria group bacterium]